MANIPKLDRSQQTKNLANTRFIEKDDVNVADVNWLIDQINSTPQGGPGSSATFCNLMLEPTPVELGPVQSFEVLGVPTQGDPPTGDAELIPGEISFRRLTDGGAIFNAALGETFWNDEVSPLDTEWNSCYVGAECGFGDLSDVHRRTFATLIEAVDYGFGGNVVGLEMVMRQKSTGRLFAITFTSWASGGGPGPYGGFAFNAQEIFADDCKIIFPDGSSLSEAVINTDRALMPNVAFVSPTGDNSTATVGDQNLPWNNISNAAANADIIIILPGFYRANLNLSDGKTYYSMPGVVFDGNQTRIQCFSANANVNWLGHAVFSGNHNGFFLQALNGTFNIEFDKMEGNRTFLEVGVDCDINISCNSIFVTGASGFAGGATIRNGANVNMSVKHFWHCYSRLVFFRVGTASYSGKFVVNCPDMRILPGGFFGNAVKTVFDMDRCDGAEFIFNGDMTNANDALGTGSASGCIGINNHFENPNTITVNGDMNGGDFNTCIFTNFQAGVDNIIVNGNITAANSFPLYLVGGLNNSIMNFTFNGSKIVGPNFGLTIRDGKRIFFRECSFYSGEVSEGLTYNITYGAGVGFPAELYFYNCIAEINNPVGGGEFISGGAGYGVIGCHNVVSADPLGAGSVDDFGGYTVIAGIKVPNF